MLLTSDHHLIPEHQALFPTLGSVYSGNDTCNLKHHSNVVFRLVRMLGWGESFLVLWIILSFLPRLGPKKNHWQYFASPTYLSISHHNDPECELLICFNMSMCSWVYGIWAGYTIFSKTHIQQEEDSEQNKVSVWLISKPKLRFNTLACRTWIIAEICIAADLWITVLLSFHPTS